jgi:hypothetical protein
MAMERDPKILYLFSGCFLVFAIAKSIKFLTSSAGITLKAYRRGMRWIEALELLHLAGAAVTCGDPFSGERMGIGSPVNIGKNLGKNDGNEWKSIESMVVFRK